jgi:hypothetical protein
MMTGFRMAIVGLALVLFGAAGIAQIARLMWLAAIIGAGELLESSLMISGMRMGVASKTNSAAIASTRTLSAAKDRLPRRRTIDEAPTCLCAAISQVLIGAICVNLWLP